MINLSALQIGTIGSGTFAKVKSLKTLDLSDNPLLGPNLRKILLSLKSTSIEKLKLQNTGLEYFPSNIIKGLCPKAILKELYLDKNNIHFLDPIFRACWNNLEILSVSDNLFFQQ